MTVAVSSIAHVVRTALLTNSSLRTATNRTTSLFAEWQPRAGSNSFRRAVDFPVKPLRAPVYRSLERKSCYHSSSERRVVCTE